MFDSSSSPKALKRRYAPAIFIKLKSLSVNGRTLGVWKACGHAWLFIEALLREEGATHLQNGET